MTRREEAVVVRKVRREVEERAVFWRGVWLGVVKAVAAVRRDRRAVALKDFMVCFVAKGWWP